MPYLENALEVQLCGAHGVSRQQVEGRLAVLVAHVGHGAVLQQQLGVLGLLQHACKVQRRVTHGALCGETKCIIMGVQRMKKPEYYCVLHVRHL